MKKLITLVLTGLCTLSIYAQQDISKEKAKILPVKEISKVTAKPDGKKPKQTEGKEVKQVVQIKRNEVQKPISTATPISIANKKLRNNKVRNSQVDVSKLNAYKAPPVLVNSLSASGKAAAPNGGGQSKDPRNLPLNQNGKLLSPDGYEVTFRTSGNPKVTSVCATPRPYFDGIAGNKSAGCSFTVGCDNPANRDAASTTTKYFQLRWHVMMDGGTSSNIDQGLIDDMMNTLNSDYSTHNMVFCEDSARWIEDAANYTHNSNTEEFSLKNTYNQRPSQLINIYVVGSMTAGGYARFPYDPSGGTSTTGGIVLNRGNCNATGHTLAHEMGHVFGLEHTFAGVDERNECSACYEEVRNANGSSNSAGTPTAFGGPYNSEGDQEGDWCSDTHPHDTYAYNCSTSSNSNGACNAFPWNNAPVNNHMSYSFCSSQFTSQQYYRMHCMVNSYLASWTSYGGGICGTNPPVSNFVASPTTWIAPSVVNFTDLSQPTAIISTWQWVFDVAASGTVTCTGCTGTNATYVGQTPPAVTYPNVGTYDVSLTVSGPNGNDTETKSSYIEVIAPAGDCDTLSLYWDNPAPNASSYGGIAAGEHILLVPDVSNSSATGIKGGYERFITPSPGVTKVGAIQVALSSLDDADDDMEFQMAVYDDNGAGEPGALLGVSQRYSPTALNVPLTGVATYATYTIPMDELIPTTASFHVGIEVFPGDLTDELVLIASSSATAEGQGNGLNHIWSTDYGYENLLGIYGLDVDLYLIPILGGSTPDIEVTGYAQNVVCDTTYVAIFDTVYDSSVSGMTYTFADGTSYSSTDPLGVIYRTYTTAGQDTLTITAINDCGRADTATYLIPHDFMPTPGAEFSRSPVDTICMGAPGVTFTANESGHQDYTWDFGDGTTTSSANTDNANHVYTTPGLYYSSLSVTSLGYQPVDTFYFENFGTGWPAGYDRYNMDAFTPDANVNPPFDGEDSTAWFVFDADGNGDNEAVSTSYNGPGEQADDWMLTSGIGVLPLNQMLTWDGESIASAFKDSYEVRISTSQLPATTANYSTLLMTVTEENASSTSRSVDLSAYAGQTVYIAFRIISTDQYLLTIDNIRVGTIGAGCTASVSKTDYVRVVDCSTMAPVAVLYGSDSAGCAPVTVTYADSTILGDSATSWLWSFGDGTFSTLQNPPPHDYDSAGTYFASFQSCNSGGCSTDFFSVVVGSGVIADAGTDQVQCGGTTATLAGNNPSPDAGNWAFISGTGTPSSPATFNSGVNGLTTGVNQFAWTITGSGCISVDTVSITVVAPSNAGTMGTQNFCSTGAPGDLFADLGGSPDTTGVWTGPDFPLTNGHLGTFTPGINSGGTFTYTVSATSPCLAAVQTVNVTINNTPDVDSLGDVTVCDGYVLPTLTVGNYFSGSGGVGSIPTGTNITSTQTIYIYSETGTTPNCSDENSFEVTVNTTPNADAPSDVTVCGSYTLPALSVGNYFASPGGVGSISAGTIISSTDTIYVYAETGTTPNCSADNSFIVTVVPAPNAGTNNTVGICATAPPVDLYLLLGTADLGGAWSGPGTALTGGDQGTFTPGSNIAGTYTYTITGNAPCSNDVATVIVTITGNDDPTFIYPDFCSDSNGVPGVINSIGGTFSFNPDPSDGSSIDPMTGIITSGMSGATYNVQYLTPTGACQDSLTLAINVGTPRNAGSNNTLTVCSTDGTTNLETLLGGAESGGSWLPSLNSGTGVYNPGMDAGTTYTYTLTGSNGCPNESSDVAVTLNTTPVADAPANVRQCDSYTLPALTVGNYYSTSGGIGAIATGTIITGTQTIFVYAETGTTPNCTDENSFTVTIDVTPTADAPSDVTACDSYTLPNLTVGNYYSASGGVGSIPVGTSIITTDTIYVYAETGTTPNCTDENSFIITINTTPTVDILPDTTVCSSFTLPNLSSGAYFSGSGGTGSLAVGSVISSNQTIYIYAETGTTPNCFDESSFDVTIIANPTADAPADVAVCDDYTLPALTNGNYFSSSMGVNALSAGTVINSNQTVYVYSETGTTPNCTTENSFDIAVNTTPSVDSVGDVTNCGNYILPALSNGGYYSSTGGVGPLAFGTAITSTQTVFIYDETGTTPNCSDERSFSVTINSAPSVSALGGTTICEGDSVDISASGASSYLWDNSLGTNAMATVHPTTTTTYNVTGTTSGCTDQAQVTVVVNPLPTIVANADFSICEGDTGTLTAFGAASYSWDNGAGTGSNVLVNPTTTTTYTVTGTDANNCTNTDTVTISIDALPSAPVITYSGGTLETGSYPSYQWYLNDTLIDGATFQLLTPPENGVYTVLGITGGGTSCPDLVSDPFTVTDVVGIVEKATYKVQLFPNPNNGVFTLNINLKRVQDLNISIRNVLGEEISSKNLHSKYVSDQINISQHAAGVYYVLIQIGDDVVVRKVIKD